MPRNSKLLRSQTFRNVSSITSNPLLDLLLPAFAQKRDTVQSTQKRRPGNAFHTSAIESSFFTALSRVSSCPQHKHRIGFRLCPAEQTNRAALSTTNANRQDKTGHKVQVRSSSSHNAEPRKKSRFRGQPQIRSNEQGFFDFNEQEFAAGTRLPSSFFQDIDTIRNLIPPQQVDGLGKTQKATHLQHGNKKSGKEFMEQVNLLRSVRDLEEKLAMAKKNLHLAMTGAEDKRNAETYVQLSPEKQAEPVILSKEDYKNLVDLYFYSHNSRFSPESTDSSPTPLFLDDYSFTLSADFSQERGNGEVLNEDEDYTSPVNEIERMLKEGTLREISVMQVFIDLLLDDNSSNRALYEAYQQFPYPGVNSLPSSVVRLFLQRMSTPWTLSEKSMMRYLSLVDDMQAAKLPITRAEWSSAIYLAGRSFARVTQSDLTHSFGIWKQMENKAGVRSSNVTLNILFDIAVRAGKFALGETILKEMHQRNLRLNRLGRVSLMYYHGLRGDGDGVRKAYRDFVEAGEIVDTLVLNCVIASLINAQEPTAAEQIYLRMKDMHSRRQHGQDLGTDDHAPYRRYPNPSDIRLGNELASNSLGRILWRAPHLKDILPDHHAELQGAMPLKPDMQTFRPMLAYHASVSGDLDKLTVLLHDMIEVFKLPVSTIVFQLLFKGFAIHGPMGGSSTVWTKNRLDTVWDACRTAIKASRSNKQESDHELMLPSMSEVNKVLGISEPDRTTGIRQTLSDESKTERKSLSSWDLLVMDLAAFPRERLKRIHRFHSSQFDDDEPSGDSSDIHPAILSPSQREVFETQFFQSKHYDAPQEAIDYEEGEYVLPNPAQSRLMDPNGHLDNEHQRDTTDDNYEQTDSSSEGYSSAQKASPEVFATRPLINWLIRAYARCTCSRDQVEEIFNSVRKVWKPRDEREGQSIIRVLKRCLKDCDQANGLG